MPIEVPRLRAYLDKARKHNHDEVIAHADFVMQEARADAEAHAAQETEALRERCEALKDVNDRLMGRWLAKWGDPFPDFVLAALREQLQRAEERVGFAERLLERVVIHGGAGSWSWREMHDWCCDYKDFRNGSVAGDATGHENCGHRKRPGTDCGAIGAGDSDEPVHHLFGPDGLWQRAKRAEEERDQARDALDLRTRELVCAEERAEKAERERDEARSQRDLSRTEGERRERRKAEQITRLERSRTDLRGESRRQRARAEAGEALLRDVLAEWVQSTARKVYTAQKAGQVAALMQAAEAHLAAHSQDTASGGEGV